MHYLDNAATTRPSEAAVAALMRSATVCYGNPSSLHALGFEAERELREARRSVAKALGTQPERIVFTGSGTEASNLALFGLADRRRAPRRARNAARRGAARRLYPAPAVHRRRRPLA